MEIERDFIFDPSLVLYLPLYKLDGASVLSQDAYGHLCTVTGALWRPDGRYFDGNDDKITVPDAPSLDIIASLTLMAWVYVSTAVGFAGILTKKDDAGDSAGYMLDTQGGNGRIKTSSSRAEGAVSAESWHHVVGTYIGGTLRLFIDGELRDEVGGQSLLSSAKDVVVGFWDGAEGTYAKYFNGYIGEVRIYSRVLTPLEVQHNYLASKWRYR